MMCRTLIVEAGFNVKHTIAISKQSTSRMQNPWNVRFQVCDFGRENIIVVGNVHTQKQYPRNFDLGSITIPRMCATERQPRLTWKKKFLFYLSSFFSLCWEIVSLNPPFTYSQRVVGGVNDAIALYLFSLLTNRRSTRRMPD